MQVQSSKIKSGLKCCQYGNNCEKCTFQPKHSTKGSVSCARELLQHASAYIHQLETRNKKLIVDAERTINLADDDFGAVLNCAIRYSLGRQTYMPHLVMDFIRPLLPSISNRTLWCIARDIKEAEIYGGYGSPVIDEPCWKNFLQEIETEIEKRNI